MRLNAIAAKNMTTPMTTTITTGTMICVYSFGSLFLQKDFEMKEFFDVK